MINPNWSPQSGRPPFPNVAVGILMKYSSGMQHWKSRQTQECGVNCLIGNGVLAVHVQTGSALVSSCVITPPVLIGTEVKLCMEEPSSLSVIMTTAEEALMKEKWKEAEILIWNNVAVPLLSPRRHTNTARLNAGANQLPGWRGQEDVYLVSLELFRHLRQRRLQDGGRRPCTPAEDDIKEEGWRETSLSNR